MITRKNLFILLFFVLNCFPKIVLTDSNYYSSFLNELKNCFETKNDDKCKKMILRAEQLQIDEYYKGNLKCQTSILGLQTELIRHIYFDGYKPKMPGKVISSLIKNC